MPRPLDIACLQLAPAPDIEAALAHALPLAEEAARGGARMLFLPEYCGGLRTDGAAIAAPSAPEGAHPFVSAMQEFAAAHEVWLHLGSVAVDAPDGRIVNRGYMIDPSGHVTGHYDKIHLFDIQLSETEVYRESDRVNPGDCAKVHDTPLARVGHTICYDLRFAHLYRALAQDGAQILTCPAAFTARTGAAHWHVLNRARAIETTRFMVAAAMTGAIPGGGETYGHSLVVDPWGEVLADGADGPGVVAASIDLDLIAKTEGRIPSLMNDAFFTGV